MARQKGILKLSGTIGNINFYVVDGIGYAREAGGGFNGEAIRTKKSMARVRENGSEFGRSSAVKKKMLQAFHPFVSKRERGFHNRCVGLFLKLKDLDTVSKRGQRRVEKGLATARGRLLFKGFPFGKPMGFLDDISYRWQFEEAAQRLDLPFFLRADYPELKSVKEINVSLFLVDFNFEKREFHKHELDKKTLLVQEENPAQALFPASPVSMTHTPIYYVGIELVGTEPDKKAILGMKVV